MVARVGAGWLVIALIVCAPAIARADDDAKSLATRAVELANQGRTSGDASKFDQAIGLFKQAFALDPRPEYQCGIGIAYADAGKPAPAHLFIGRCIARTVSAERKQQLRAFHDSLEKTLVDQGFVPVDVAAKPAGASVQVSYFADDETVPAPVTVWLPVGEYGIRVESAGFVAVDTRFAVPAGEKIVRLEYTLEREPVVEPPREPEKQPIADPVTEPAPRPQPIDRTPAPRSNRLSWIMIGGGAGAVVGGAVFHLLAYRDIGDAGDLPLGQDRDDLIGTIKLERTVAVGLYAVGAAAIGVGTYLRLRRPAASGSVDVSFAPRAGGGVVSLEWRR